MSKYFDGELLSGYEESPKTTTSNTSDFVDLLNKEIEELQKAIREPIKCANTATEIERDCTRRIMLENQLYFKQGCLSKNYYYESQINELNEKIEDKDKRIKELEEQLAIMTKALELACERVKYFEEMQDKEMGFSEFFGYDSNYDLQAIIEQYKEYAKEIIKSE